MMNNFDEIMATKHNQFANLYYMVHGLLHKAGLDYMHISVIIKTEPYPNASVTRTTSTTNKIVFTSGLLQTYSSKDIKACASHEVGHLITFQYDKPMVAKSYVLRNGMISEARKDYAIKNMFPKSTWNEINAVKWILLILNFVTYVLAWDYNFSGLCSELSYIDGVIAIIIISFVIYDNFFTLLYHWYVRQMESEADIIGSSLTSPKAMYSELITTKKIVHEMNIDFHDKPVSKFKIILGLLDHPTTKTRIRKIAKANH